MYVPNPTESNFNWTGVKEYWLGTSEANLRNLWPGHICFLSPPEFYPSFCHFRVEMPRSAWKSSEKWQTRNPAKMARKNRNTKHQLKVKWQQNTKRKPAGFLCWISAVAQTLFSRRSNLVTLVQFMALVNIQYCHQKVVTMLQSYKDVTIFSPKSCNNVTILQGCYDIFTNKL